MLQDRRKGTILVKVFAFLGLYLLLSSGKLLRSLEMLL